jgi:hypothetical protein
MAVPPVGARTRLAITCIHCGRRVMTVPSITDDDLVFLAAHLRMRHAEHYKPKKEKPLDDVLRHFKVATQDVD